nr:hypothetical protein [Thioalkalivibrio sp. XN8]
MPDLVTDTLRLLNSVQYTGFASVEYKKNPHDGRYYLVEINPRLPWYNSLFTACGINFPLIYFQDVTGQGAEIGPIRQRDSVYWLHLRNELRGAWERKKRGQWSHAFRGLVSIRRARAFGLFSLGDLRPFFVGYGNYFREYFGAGARSKRA